MSLNSLFSALAGVFDGPQAIERVARDALLSSRPPAGLLDTPVDLAQPFLDVMLAPDAHPVCRLIAETPFAWAPPQTSGDARYVEHSLPKVHVELIGPDGLVASESVRLGLYGMLPGFEYGIRTHPAEEVFVMLAGQAHWKRGSDPYLLLGPGERSYHPSMLPHANRTDQKAFLSVYIWHGDVSTDQYSYKGHPTD